jgi:hypothetical protein
MRPFRALLATLAIISCAVAGCGSDKPAASDANATVAQASADTSGADVTQPAAGGGTVDCAGLNDALASMIVNWQVVIGLTNSPTSEWAQVPLGTIPKFGDQLAAITAALGSDADAAAALKFMSGANDIVQRGLGGDAAAQADLVTYMGTDISASVGKQLPISLAYSNAGC